MYLSQASNKPLKQPIMSNHTETDTAPMPMVEVRECMFGEGPITITWMYGDAPTVEGMTVYKVVNFEILVENGWEKFANDAIDMRDNMGIKHVHLGEKVYMFRAPVTPKPDFPPASFTRNSDWHHVKVIETNPCGDYTLGLFSAQGEEVSRKVMDLKAAAEYLPYLAKKLPRPSVVSM